MNEKELERLNREHDEESLSGMTMLIMAFVLALGVAMIVGVILI
jgi:hypothetical protein